jgi:hypothetical protein
LEGIDVILPGNPKIQIADVGDTLPIGTIFPANDTFTAFPAGFVVPADVFPAGLPAIINHAAGSQLTAPLTLTAGTNVPAGMTFPTKAFVNGGVMTAAGVALPTQVTLAANYALSADLIVGGTVSTPTQTYTAGMIIPAGTDLPVGTVVGAGVSLPFAAAIDSMTWPANTPLTFASNTISPAQNITLAGGTFIPGSSNLLSATGSTQLTRDGQIWAAAAMLPPGSLSWSMRLVAGADLTAADTRTLQAADKLDGNGNLTLNDPHFAASSSSLMVFSVLRTGTGDLDLLAGGNFSEASPFGVYTAGTQSAGIGSNGSDPYNLARGLASDGTLFKNANAPYASAVSGTYQAWYPENGGDVLVSAQGNVSGYIAPANSNNSVSFDSDAIGQWLWRQGGDIAGQQTAWWINFGTYALEITNSSTPVLTGFQGIGTLGGGNLTVIAGRNAGTLGGNSGLDLAVASTGRVLPDGTIVQTGGGNLTLRVGDALNPTTFSGVEPNKYGALTDLRGDIDIAAGSVGVILRSGTDPSDPRAQDSRTVEIAQNVGGPTVAPGDGTVTIATRGDLVLGGASDAGMVKSANVNGVQTASGGNGGSTSFTLWTQDTSIDLYSAGGNLSPGASADGSLGQNNGIGLYPGTLIAAAASGNLYVSGANASGTSVPIELMPSPVGQLELLAAGSMYGGGASIAMSGADMSSLATPLNPVFTLGSGQITNANPNSAFQWVPSGNLSPIAFGPDTPTTNLHGDDSKPALIYAGGDIVNVQVGFIDNLKENTGANFVPAPTTWYIGAKPFRIIAGRDIIGGTRQTATSPASINFIFNNNPDDISLVHAGRDIIYDSVTIGGPGLLDVQAGRNLYQGYLGSLESIGPLVNIDPSNRSSGAGISIMAGVGVNGPDYTDFAKLYFDPANQLPAGAPLADSGKVAKSYDNDLYTWLTQRFSAGQHYSSNGESYVFTGSKNDALAFFLTLPSEQQGVFVRQVYFEELTAGGREETGALASPRLGSYLRGRDAIAALFPSEDANGNPITYSGDVTMFSGKVSYNKNSGLPDSVFNPNDIVKQFDAGIRTVSGGDIQILTPGGETITGVEGLAPGSTAGVLTQGAGDIQIYSLDSILLGQTRIMTTDGGDIIAWSAEGDINAGRGSKTTQVFNPPQRIYDRYGNITLSPNAPSSGAGIAALNSIPGLPPGHIDLIAPLGTIDAGEAGIRSSGDINLAGLHLVNTANISAQGNVSGVPQIQAPNIGGLTEASNTAGAAAQQAMTPGRGSGNAQPSIIIVEVLGFGGGDGTSSPGQDSKGRDKDKQSYDTNAPVQIVGHGALTETQLSFLTPEERQRKLQDVAGR